MNTKPFEVTKKSVWNAYLKVKRNRGAAGVDDQTLEDFDQNLKDNLFKIWNRMASGTYFPPPVKGVEIPKKNGGVRLLGVPTVADRIAQMVVKDELEPLVEPQFHVDSYGYRPGKSAHDAIAVTVLRSSRSNYILEFDIKGLFDNIGHELLLKAVKHHTDCKWVILYIERWLKASIVLPSGENQKRDSGTPQGGVISPLLANLFLHYTFDLWVTRTFPKLPFCRYADDGLIHCYSFKQAQLVRSCLDDRFRQCGLTLHADKTRIVYCGLGTQDEPTVSSKMAFLGFDFKLRKCRRDKGWETKFYPGISLRAMKHCREIIKSWKLYTHTHTEIETIAQMINPVIKGWINYYGKFYKTALKSVFAYLNVCLMKWAKSKYKKLTSKTKGTEWMTKVCKARPGLFAHWAEGFTAWNF